MPIELILLASGLNTLLPRLWEHGRDHRRDQRKKRIAIDLNLEDIKTKSTRLLDAIEDPKFKGDGTPSAMNLKREARVLCQKTLDSINLFFRDKKASNTKFEEKTREHRLAMKDLCERIEKYTPQEKATKKPEEPCATDHMAMEDTVKEVRRLIELPSDMGRKVISILGFPGLGKTIIAKLVYDRIASELEPDMPDCTFRAWVTAAAKDASVVLKEILEEADAQSKNEGLGLEKLSLATLRGKTEGELLAQRLRGQKYFIVIDDVQTTQQWKNMNEAFPKDVNGTIIVTTSIQSVANVCSPFKGYVYNLSVLDDHKSLDLFMKDRSEWKRDWAKKYASDIMKKCDGLPLAIVSMSDILKSTRTGVPTVDACKTVCAELGTYLLGGGNDLLERLRWVLMNKYTGLTCDALKSCLLYYCLYKHNMDAVPRRNCLTRRWEAEGFLVLARNQCLTPRAFAEKNLNTLLDQNIMQSMEVGTNGSTRRCRPPGMMLEYISSISMSENFAASVSAAALPSGIRRLSFHPGSGGEVKTEDLKIVLTLAVSGIGCQAILDFKKYELIVVLDLKDCTNLEEKHVRDICKLVLLKYLSLGNSIEEIPEAIGALTQLETLEMRRDETVSVHAELLELPNLKYLIGNFELVEEPDCKKLKNFLNGESSLEIATGYVTSTARGFPALMQHMKRLRKVKIHCTPTATHEDQKDLQMKIKAFTREGTNDTRICRSLSVDFTGFNNGIQQSPASPLEFLKVAGSLDALKLRGNWIPLQCYDGDWRPFILHDGRKVPDLTKISAITKLCLSGTCLSGNDVLAGLAHFTALGYLKLEEQELGPLEIKSDNLKQVTRLCLVGERSLHGITVEPGALPILLSLHLICEAIHPGLESSIEGGCVMALNEIALDSGVDGETIIDPWKTAANGHPNRPQVFLFKKDAPVRQA